MKLVEFSGWEVAALRNRAEMTDKMTAYCNGLEKAKSIYRVLHPGGCRMLSEGDSCRCFLCQIDEAKRQR